MARHLARLFLMGSLALGALGFLAAAAAAQEASPGASAESPSPRPPVDGRRVGVLTATGVVDNVMAGYLAEGVAQAGRDGAAAVVIQLNTPGGSLDATQRIVSTLLEAPLPTIVWVTPSGARAASAGTFITMASHVALMAPGTNIGAATPVGGQGEDIGGDLGQKVRNDAVASIRSISEIRGRNADWAEETVRDARSSAATEALDVGAIDGIAGSIDAVVAFADGRVVEVRGTPTTIATAGATPSELPMNPAQQLLHLLSDPNIAFILFTVGFYGLLFELQSPNFVTGILGALAIVLAFIGFGSLPLNVAGVLLIVLAIVLFLLEFTVTSHGMLTVGGIVCFAIGASALYTAPGTPTGPIIAVDPAIIATFTVLTGGYMAFILFVVVRWRRRMSGTLGMSTGPVLFSGALGEVRTSLLPLGVVYAAGEEWTARTEDGSPIAAGAAVRIKRRDGLTLIVEPADRPPGPDDPTVRFDAKEEPE
ncbi:MAG TPA: nodulation protein NfeD [Methylomirabilota bacterium]|nr:nodulation protein NfeD [Methylomirabilota bacterium]